MTTAISIAPETSYMPDWDIKNQLEEDDEEAHKAYVQLMDLLFLILVNKLIEIIDHALKSENWAK